MTTHYALDPRVTPELTEAVLALWADVTEAGGAVGFVPPVTGAEILPVWQAHLRAVAAGGSRLLLGRDDAGDAVALAFLQLNDSPRTSHWLWLYRVMVHPKLQGRGEGRRLMAAAEAAARGIEGIGAIRLTCRGGLGLEHFYASCGYKEVGRVPAGIRVSDEDLRDDITMWLPLL